jgi:hypothetical protein
MGGQATLRVKVYEPFAVMLSYLFDGLTSKKGLHVNQDVSTKTHFRFFSIIFPLSDAAVVRNEQSLHLLLALM